MAANVVRWSTVAEAVPASGSTMVGRDIQHGGAASVSQYQMCPSSTVPGYMRPAAEPRTA
jgi:hypothetical protein